MESLQSGVEQWGHGDIIVEQSGAMTNDDEMMT